MAVENERVYRFRKGIHGEFCVDFGQVVFTRMHTVTRCPTESEAIDLVKLLNTLQRRADGRKEGDAV